MPVAPTFPGVYLQEIPSGVRAITGVATSIGAFIDFFPRGPLDQAVQVFSFADVERIFGGLHTNSEASYGLEQFFRNGGSSAWVVRVSNKTRPAAAATALVRTQPASGALAVTFSAADPGVWGNQVRVRVEPSATPVPAGTPPLFGVVAREVQIANGREAVLKEVRYSELSITPGDAQFIEAVINNLANIPGAGGLIRATVAPGAALPPAASGFFGTAVPVLPPELTGGAAKPLTVALLAATANIDLGVAPITTMAALATTLQTVLRAEAAAGGQVAGNAGFLGATVQAVGRRLVVVPGAAGSFTFTAGPVTTAMGLVAGSAAAPVLAAGAKAGMSVDLIVAGGTTDTRNLDLGTAAVMSLEELATRLEAALRSAQPTNTAMPAGRVEFAQATVRLVGDRLQVIPGVGAQPLVRFTFADTAGTLSQILGLNLPANSNIAAYDFGNPITVTADGRAQNASTAGADGDPPDALDIIGSEGVTPPTGMFALNLADLFNLMCLPRVARAGAGPQGFHPFNEAQVDFTVSAATTYCERRRSMLLLDTPDNIVTPVQIKQWMTDHASLRHPNLTIYFPRVMMGDPLDSFRDRSFGASGSIAGICSRTDASRGVWKAPAGTESILRGVSRLQVKLTDAENGVLNPLGINCLRTFDLYGNVNWGARTLFGEDARGSEWRYQPIRRLALYLEETLFRSTTWVIFEPNDEPLWAQIRLSVGSFMNDLFRKGAFQGKTKQEAYFVHCDSSTTSPLDQERGIVNVVVGFAPLKPAEFLIISIQQIPQRLEV